MSNVLKSKVLLGAMIVLAAFVGAMFIATTANAAYTHSTTLKMGSTGSQVMELQKALNATSCKVAASGVGSSGMESTYFGALTKAAVMCYQSANALTSDGVVGPMTGAKLAMVEDDDSDDDSNDDSDLQGGAGSVEEYDLISGLNNEEVGEDEEDVQVAGLEIEADEGSDLEFTAVKLVFDENTGATTSDFEDYASEVSVWFDGEEVARVDGDAFNDDNNWTKTLSLDGAVLEAGETGELVVAVSGVSNLDSNDSTDPWDVDFASVRFVDAQNASTTEDPGTAVRVFTFESFATANDVELKIASDDDDINDAHVIEVDATDDTDNVDILSFTMEADGDSDIIIDALPVNFDVTGAGHVDDVITGLTLFAGGEEIGSSSVGSDCIEDADCADVGADETYLFDDLDFTIDAGDKVEFLVKADLLSIADDLDEGDTIAANFGETQTDSADFDAEDEAGEDLVDADMTGSSTGEAHGLYSVGIKVELVSVDADEITSADAENEVDEGTYVIKYKVTAFGADIYVDGTTTEDGDGTYAAGQGNSYFIQNTDGTSAAAGTTPTAAGLSTTADSAANTTWLVEEDTSETFTLTVTVSNTFTGDASSDSVLAQVALKSIGWDTSAIAATANNYTFNLDEFETDPLTLSEIDNA